VSAIEIPRLPSKKIPVSGSYEKSPPVAKPLTKNRIHTSYDDLLGIGGLVITLTVILSGVYVFYRSLQF
jgi:hypothetical protein